MPLADARRAVLTDIAYEIGGAGLAKFKDMLAAIRLGLWETAAAELKDSLLYSQVKKREDRNISILLSGEFPVGITSGRSLTKLNEGCILTSAPDAKGKWAIGYGHDIVPPGAEGHIASCIQDEAEGFFDTDYPLAESRAEADLGSEYW